MNKPLWQKLLKLALEDDKEPVLNCHECYSLMDQYADMLLDGVQPSEVMLLVKEHLSHCAGCEEIFESLMLMVQVDGSDQPALGST